MTLAPFLSGRQFCNSMNKSDFVREIFILFITVILLGMNISPAQGENKKYLIGPRDVLSLTIYAGGEEQQSVKLTVSEKGMINVPFIGTVKAAGLTISELRSKILEPLARDYFVNPEINLYIEEYHSLEYYITGAVNSPGLYQTSSEQTLLTLIAKAGGVISGRYKLAYILRGSAKRIEGEEDLKKLINTKKPESIDLIKLLDKGDMSKNIKLRPGDVVYIPLEEEIKNELTISVEGEVKNPGIFPFKPGLTALKACLMAGGFDKFAAPNRAKIVRKKGEKQIVIKINLNKVREGEIPDMELKPGDLINIPETWL